MQIPLQITTRGMDVSEAVDKAVRKHVAKLEHFSDRIVSCRVTVEVPESHQQQGKLHAVHVDLRVPGDEIISSHAHENMDVYVALRDAFSAVQRRLEDHVRRQRGQ
ncbi:MAG TPA: ribosome-associated translation inhibitor RaiA [Burkholderiaceae bacterium]|nr:ribosome-associated translation inhibitor RaiA [Burkholderiaceae bacterium]